jgi:2'-hydroxyisoflavone reductase
VRLLVIGGTLFLGRHLVDAALAAGHEVTLFNRGRTNPELYPGLDAIRGDREADLRLLVGRRWDAAIDTCGYLPRVVRASARALRDRVEHYTFVSSASVYADPPRPGADEGAAVQTVDEALAGEFAPERYGALKALCEREVEEALPGRALMVRAGLLVGPHDRTGRLPYWIRRLADGGEVIAPGSPGRQVQLVDARDAAEWMLRMAERRRGGTFNVSGPEGMLTMGGLLDAIAAATRSEARLTWVAEAFLLAQEVAPWTELPIWLPEEWNGILSLSIRRALAEGLAFRPLEETIRDTFTWMESGGGGPGALTSGMKLPPALSREREAALLRRWARERESGL